MKKLVDEAVDLKIWKFNDPFPSIGGKSTTFYELFNNRFSKIRNDLYDDWNLFPFDNYAKERIKDFKKPTRKDYLRIKLSELNTLEIAFRTALNFKSTNDDHKLVEDVRIINFLLNIDKLRKATLSKIRTNEIKKFICFNWRASEEFLKLLFEKLNGEFIKTNYSNFKAIFGKGKLKKRVQWLQTETMIVYFIDLLFDYQFIDYSYYDYRHSITSKTFINKKGNAFKNKQLAQVYQNYYYKPSRKPRNGEKIENLLANLISR